MVVWLIGLSRAGKTTIGRELYRQWKAEESNTVLIDGDEIRGIFKSDIHKSSYALDGRRKNADRICEICAWLDRQEINVVCCILSIFEESRQWNRGNLSEYFEVYIKVASDILIDRDDGRLYKPALRGELTNVVNVDIPFNEPKCPDFIFNNSEPLEDFSGIAAEILQRAKSKFR
tara:strand:+ start:4820 stop:5344 length:525 start_codon:yes stop_codon:yes gene_type:complete